MTHALSHHAQQLLGVLSLHVGGCRGITAQDLARELDITQRRLRTLVSALREAGIAVCGTPTSGYFIAESPEDIEHTCNFLRSRAMHSLVLEARLRKIPLPDLLGQLHLRT